MFVNGKNYAIPELGFGEIRKLKNYGINIYLKNANDVDVLDMLSGVVALAMGVDMDRADIEIQAHVTNGYDIETLTHEMSEEFARAVADSPFIKALNKRATQPKKKTTTKPSTS